MVLSYRPTGVGWTYDTSFKTAIDRTHMYMRLNQSSVLVAKEVSP